MVFGYYGCCGYGVCLNWSRSRRSGDATRHFTYKESAETSRLIDALTSGLLLPDLSASTEAAASVELDADVHLCFCHLLDAGFVSGTAGVRTQMN